MADAYTPNLNLVQPEIGASRDTWGTKWNSNAALLDDFVSQAMPIGSLLDFAGPQAPSGWLIADGRLVSRTTYSDLFGAIGTAWGAGDGSTNFALPNMNGRTAVGAGSITDPNGTVLSLSFAQSLGELSTHILQAHMPNYTITTNPVAAHSHGGVTAPGGNHTHATDAQGSHSHGGSVQGAGTGMSINDPWHAHGYPDRAIQGTGYIAGTGTPTGYDSQDFGRNTYAAPTGITLNDPGHVHVITLDGSHGHNITYSGNLQLGIYADNAHSHTMTLGGSGALLSLMQPTAVVTKIIYAGNQATTTMRAAAAESAVNPLDDLADIRAEVAELRMLLGQRRHRVMSSPLRGLH